MKLIYSNENLLLVNNIKNILENAGIAVIIKNEYASGGVGELSPFDTWPEVWAVHDSDYELANKICSSYQNQGDKKDWVCQNCLESNTLSFELCWNCQQPMIKT